MKSKITMSVVDGDGSGPYDRDISVAVSERETIQVLVETFVAFALVAGYVKKTVVDAMADFVDAEGYSSINFSDADDNAHQPGAQAPND